MLAARFRRALTTVPTARDWLEATFAAALLAAVIGPLGLSSGLLVAAARPWTDILPLAAIAFLIPALGEELLFRAPIPDRAETPHAGRAVAGSVLAFTAWHVVETIWLPTAALIFLRSDFLATAALLGLACAVLRRRSGSIWTAVVLHWLAVVAWQGWLGGPHLAALTAA